MIGSFFGRREVHSRSNQHGVLAKRAHPEAVDRRQVSSFENMCKAMGAAVTQKYECWDYWPGHVFGPTIAQTSSQAPSTRTVTTTVTTTPRPAPQQPAPVPNPNPNPNPNPQPGGNGGGGVSTPVQTPPPVTSAPPANNNQGGGGGGQAQQPPGGGTNNPPNNAPPADTDTDNDDADADDNDKDTPADDKPSTPADKGSSNADGESGTTREVALNAGAFSRTTSNGSVFRVVSTTTTNSDGVPFPTEVLVPIDENDRFVPGGIDAGGNIGENAPVNAAKKSNTGAIVGGVLGALALILILIALVVIRRRRRRQRMAPSQEFMRRFPFGNSMSIRTDSPSGSSGYADDDNTLPGYTRGTGHYPFQEKSQEQRY